ncbi:MAG: molybdopterin dinucleotide binding domain-containing protein, partial [Propionibacteriaceae bacterium]
SGTVHHRTGRNDQVVLAGWRTLLDDSRSVDNEPDLQGTARRPVARLNPRTAAAAGIEAVPGEDLSVTVTGGAGSVTLPVELVDDMVLGTVWMPSRNRGQQALGARPGEQVTITPALPGRTPRRGSQP